MSVTDEVTLAIEETQLDVSDRSGPSPWLILGIIGAILAVVFGIRFANARGAASGEAVPTDIGDVGDPAAESNGSGT
jgi:hypothetical protein